MGYACPVCEVPQQDAEHLANHLAFTAMVDGDDHEDWLDNHVSGWGQMGPAELGPRVADHAVETEYDEVFEDTVERHGHAHGESMFDDAHGHQHDHPHAGGATQPSDSLDAEAEQILQEAADLTAQMVTDESGDDESSDDGKES